VSGVRLLDDPAPAAAERLAAAASAGGQIALAGGSTPRAAYEIAAGLEAEWSGATLWFGDERCVPPDDERSNYRLAAESLLNRIEGAAPRVHRIRGELGSAEAADAYETELREAFGEDPALDLVMLGLGSDGHCASLFPDQPALEERERLAVQVPDAGLPPHVPRVTLTLTAINAAREVLFLVSGEDKAEAAARAFEGGPDPGTPASLVRPQSGSLTVLLDPAAASRMKTAERSPGPTEPERSVRR
jgi:6-phosphogluconolactonase